MKECKVNHSVPMKAIGQSVMSSSRRFHHAPARDVLRDLPTPTLVVHGVADVPPIAEVGYNPYGESSNAFFAAVHTFLAEGSPDS